MGMQQPRHGNFEAYRKILCCPHSAWAAAFLKKHLQLWRVPFCTSGAANLSIAANVSTLFQGQKHAKICADAIMTSKDIVATMADGLLIVALGRPFASHSEISFTILPTRRVPAGQE